MGGSLDKRLLTTTRRRGGESINQPLPFLPLWSRGDTNEKAGRRAGGQGPG